MSPRYYIGTAILVLVLTVCVSIWKQKRTGKEIFIVFCQVVFSLALILALVAGFARLLAFLGIAQSGFIL
ncbi:MAG: hypothetical protein ACE5E9_10270 [Nitrospinaceae bacterium]